MMKKQLNVLTLLLALFFVAPAAGAMDLEDDRRCHGYADDDGSERVPKTVFRVGVSLSARVSWRAAHLATALCIGSAALLAEGKALGVDEEFVPVFVVGSPGWIRYKEVLVKNIGKALKARCDLLDMIKSIDSSRVEFGVFCRDVLEAAQLRISDEALALLDSPEATNQFLLKYVHLVGQLDSPCWRPGSV